MSINQLMLNEFRDAAYRAHTQVSSLTDRFLRAGNWLVQKSGHGALNRRLYDQGIGFKTRGSALNMQATAMNRIIGSLVYERGGIAESDLKAAHRDAAGIYGNSLSVMGAMQAIRGVASTVRANHKDTRRLIA